MKFEWKTLFFTGILSCATACFAQETRPEWDCAGDSTCCEEQSEGEVAEGENHRYHRDYFFSPQLYDKDYERGYKEPVPAPDWPGANDLLMDQLSR